MTVNDFDLLLVDLGQSVSIEVVTTSYGNVSGSKTVSYASPASITILLAIPRVTYGFDKEALYQAADRRVLSKTTDAVKKNDRITIGSDKFIVHDVARREVSVGGTYFACDVCALYKE